ncbi:MAG: DUF5329 domain-containing protein, partial [Chromatiales bacterium]|nr:DUF5329 domain-containing protein [Chromatiales bacterium]
MNIHVSNSLSHPLSVIVATVTMLALTLPGLARATPDAAVAETIEYLIASVSESDLTFIRNGKRYAGSEAAEHMRKKYD